MFLLRRILHSNKGQSLIELSLIAPLMIMLAFGAIEVGSVISTYLTMSHTTREGANLASRGTPPNQALDAIIAAGAPTIREGPSGNEPQWRIIYSRIIPDPDNHGTTEPYNYLVDTGPTGQIVRGALNKASKLGGPGTQVTQAQLPGIENVQANQRFDVVEVFYDYAPSILTFVGKGIGTDFYERAIFTNVTENN
jgi:hypothetical protein